MAAVLNQAFFTSGWETTNAPQKPISTQSRNIPTPGRLTGSAFYGLAHTYLKLKENQKAVDAFAGALQIDPETPSIYRDLALLAWKTATRIREKCS